MNDFQPWDDTHANEARARRQDLAALLIRRGEADMPAITVPGYAGGGTRIGVIRCMTRPLDPNDFAACCARAGFDPLVEYVAVLAKVARDGAPPREDERTGLPCPDCGTRQRAVDIHRGQDGSLVVRLSFEEKAEEVAARVKGVVSMLKMFARGTM